jgi:hypothetical protein
MLPVAMAPITVPMKKGVSSEEKAKAAPAARCRPGRDSSLRKANPEPRSTIPATASHSGTAPVVITAANACGKPVQKITRSKTSQTWLASQTGLIDSSISRLGSCPRRSPPASRSHRPPPKSAPPSTAYKVTEASRMPPTAAAAVMARPGRECGLAARKERRSPGCRRGASAGRVSAGPGSSPCRAPRSR